MFFGSKVGHAQLQPVDLERWRNTFFYHKNILFSDTVDGFVLIMLEKMAKLK